MLLEGIGRLATGLWKRTSISRPMTSKYLFKIVIWDGVELFEQEDKNYDNNDTMIDDLDYDNSSSTSHL